MSGFLFDEIIFGPVISRRLGISLGINLLPLDQKLCSFNCIYCECGFTAVNDLKKISFFDRKDIYNALDHKLKELVKQKISPDSLTFAGNGEPTLHPEFAEIISDTIILGTKYFPLAKITVLSNSSTLDDENVFNALKKVNNVMKLDSAIQESFILINNISGNTSVIKVIENLEKFEGKLVIQTMFLKGSYNGIEVDNTTVLEINEWLNALKKIKPSEIMIYSIDRIAPVKTIERISKKRLEEIALMAEKLGFNTKVY
jgi:wyosine [tRNA(Phe)-imidazoG37] synthetase (radical SAM superfamily)